MSIRAPGRDWVSGGARNRPRSFLGVWAPRVGLIKTPRRRAASAGSLGSWDATPGDSRAAPTPQNHCQPGRPSPLTAQHSLCTDYVSSQKDPLSHHPACICVQSLRRVCDLMDQSPAGSSVHGISQARILEWVAIPFSRRSSQPWDQIGCLMHW